nr:NP1450L [African swine fever virus]
MEAGYAEIAAVQFNIAGGNDHKRQGVMEVTISNLFEGTLPAEGGIYDARMGTTDHHYKCITCSHQRKQCMGHPGILQMHAPVLQPLFIAEIRRWLRVICLNCGAPIVDLKRYEHLIRPKRLIEAASSQTEGKQCYVCKAVHPKIVKDSEDYFTFWADQQGKIDKLYPQIIREIFSRVTYDTVVKLGRSKNSHPEKLVLKAIQIPPISIRPGIRLGIGSGPQSFHDINNVIQYLVRKNLLIPKDLQIVRGQKIPLNIDRNLQTIQQLYYNFLLDSVSTTATQGGTGKRGIVMGARPAPSIMRRLPRKEGRIRKSLLGSQVWSISRSTICGNSDLHLDEVGYPISFARTLQVAETVQHYNINRLMPYFLNGKRQYPGCSRVYKQITQSVHDIEGLKQDFRLEVGDILYRDVVTGDVAFFNRQPSLERSSIGVHRIVVLENPKISTFQMNVSACAWYNADFDGDQMNLWVPWSVMSRVEAELLCSVRNWFISTKSSGPVNGQVQDSTVGSFLLTRTNTPMGKNVMNKLHAMGLFQTTQTDPPCFANYSPTDLLDGKSVVSMLLRQTPINYQRAPTWYSEVYAPYMHYNKQDISTQIRNGELIEGVLDKKAVGAGSSGGIYHLISRRYGPQQALKMIFATQQLALNYVRNAGFTVSTADMLLTPEAHQEVQEIINELLLESEEINNRLLHGDIMPPIGLTTHDFYEKLQLNALKFPDRILKPIMNSINPETNGLFQMVATGAKGSNPNMIHIMAGIGQIEINTQRIQPQFSFGRTLVYYPRFALEAQAYGFICNSYIAGLTSPEFIFGEMNGRFDLINKALSTSSTGYANRKAIFGLQSCIVDYYRRVSIDTRLVQQLYGEDGLDARQLETVRFETIMLSDQELEDKFKYTGIQSPLFEEEFSRLKKDRDKYRQIFLNVENFNFSQLLTDVRQVPVNVASIVKNILLSSTSGVLPFDEKSILQKYAMVKTFCKNLPYVFINNIQERLQTPIPVYLKRAASLMRMLIRIELATVKTLNITCEQMSAILDLIRLQYTQSLINYGEAVGILAAQSVSEPLTQYMLDSHHRSVAGGTNKSGIVRPQEIFSAKPVEAEQSSEMLLRLKNPEVETNKTYAQEIANSIELITFERLILQWHLLYETYSSTKKNVMYPDFASDVEWMTDFLENHPLLQPPEDIANWCIRLELNKTTMILKSISLESIINSLRAKHPNTYIMHSVENTASGIPIIIRIYLRESAFRRSTNTRMATDEKIAVNVVDKLLNSTIRGIPGIKNANVVKLMRHRVDAQGKLVRLDNIYAIKTNGTNIFGAMLDDNIDPYTIVSSSIGDTMELYGIEAARQKIISEIRTVMGDKGPNHRHLLMYADLMTRTGQVTSLEKAGLNAREPSNVLLRMALSSPVQVLTDAAVDSAVNPIYGIAAPTLMGSVPRIGTMYSDIIMDEKYITENYKSVDSLIDML